MPEKYKDMRQMIVEDIKTALASYEGIKVE